MGEVVQPFRAFTQKYVAGGVRRDRSNIGSGKCMHKGEKLFWLIREYKPVYV